MARPSPRVPPVTSATRPERSNRPRASSSSLGLGGVRLTGDQRSRGPGGGGVAAAERSDPARPGPQRVSSKTEPSPSTRSATTPASSSSSRLPTTSQTTSSGCSRHRPRGPQAAGDLERRARAVVEDGEDALAAAAMVAQARVDEPPVLGDRLAVAGEEPRERHLGRALQVLQVAHARARPPIARPVGRADLRVGGDPSPAGDRRRTRCASASSTNSVSVVLWPGRAMTREAAPARLNAIAVGEPHVGAEVLGRGADVVPEARRCRRPAARERRGGA